MSTKLALEIKKGKTYSRSLRWEAQPIIYRPITAISQTAPVRITSVGHGVPAGWRVAIVSVRGMTQINAENQPPEDSDFRPATVIDADHIELNTVNAADFKNYTGGGYIQFNTPVDLTGYTARMSIKDKVGGTVLLSLTTENSKIELEATDCIIRLKLSATETAALTWKKGVYDLELQSPTGVVTELLSGDVAVVDEVTTT
jgi:hypothetical protein